MEESKIRVEDGAALKVAEDILSTPAGKISETPKIPEPEAKQTPKSEKEKPTDKKIAEYLNNEAAAAEQKVRFTTGGQGEIKSTSPTVSGTPASERLAKQARNINTTLNSGNPLSKKRHRKDKNSALRIANPGKHNPKKPATKPNSNAAMRAKMQQRQGGRG